LGIDINSTIQFDLIRFRFTSAWFDLIIILNWFDSTSIQLCIYISGKVHVNFSHVKKRKTTKAVNYTGNPVSWYNINGSN